MNVHKIQPLPHEVATKIKSSTSITNLNGVIVELVKNAIDANAQTVFVTVDYRRGGCVVEDDGNGIIPAEFESDGGLGKAYHTSKFNQDSQVHGRKGCFLASLSALALLTLTSHHVQHASTNTVMFHQSVTVARLSPAPRHHALKFSDHGTRVTVNDLFGNMPVRVKNRALTLQKTDELDRQWDDLKNLLISLVISNNSLSKVAVSDTDKQRKLTIRPRRGSPADGELDLVRLSSILSQAGLDTGNTTKWHAVSATVPHLTIHAALSLVPSPSKKVQFISLGADPVHSHNQTNILYSEVNRLFSMSDFGTTGRVPFASNTSTTQADSRNSGAVNKWPMFYIRIESVDGTLAKNDQELPESDRSLQRILDILTLMINEYLKAHNMRPRGGKRQGEPSAQQAEIGRESQRRALRTSTIEFTGKELKLPSFSRPGVSGNFGSWSRIKSGNSHAHGPTPDKSPLASDRLELDDKDMHPPTPTQGLILESTITDKRPQTTVQDNAVDIQGKECGDTVIPWVDPYTGISHWVNSRTGQSVNVRPSAASVLSHRPKSTGSLMTTRILDTQKRPASAVPGTQNMWFENLLGNWRNPVFGRSERPINALDTEPEHEPSANKSAHNFHERCGLDGFGASKYRGKLRKQDLKTARVMGQVDRKFILVEMVSRDHTSTLVLIDQHAADERCRIERLSQELFDSSLKAVRTIEVDPVTIDIPVAEAALFRRQVEYFKSWGIDYVVSQPPRSGRASISVSMLPTLIAERCRTEPEQLINIVRAETWKRTENGRVHPHVPFPDPGHSEDWVGRLSECPQGILNLLNSRACRTAIMFNDALTIGECMNLVKRLATCVFPFQCAHGRPSMVPLVDLHDSVAHGSNGDGGPGEVDVGFTAAFKRWQHDSPA
ncbi:putative DNA mismatch repair protein (Mlh3) [Aspergillus puulaauensis]|uniref:DNA mismatch repair protein n=1 Tax=Aspergillus puulaauensis TaxID=1220207 RepID=A0A7R7XWG1_9EURO|nr:DNA mismatch repair protein [Aspergillus puulaauensis]BCS28972.1 DNA mismatch repair protein [Aspergillus puulaauensis]